MSRSIALAIAAFALSTSLSTGAMAQIRNHHDDKPEQPKPSQPSQVAGVKPSPGALKALIALQQASNGSDAAAYAAALAAAKAAATTNEDRYLIARLELPRAAAANDFAATRSAIDVIAQSGLLPAAQVAELYSGLGGSLYTAKQYDAAAGAIERAMTLSPNDPTLINSLAETRFAQGRKADAIPLLQKVVAIRSAAGQRAEEPLYKRIFDIAYTLRSPNAVDLGRTWLTAYPNQGSWRAALGSYINLNQPPMESTVGILRLMDAVGVMSTPSDYVLLATAASEEGNYVEAKEILDRGTASGVLKPDNKDSNELIAFLKTKQASRTVAELEESARGATTAKAFVRIGDRLYGLGQYAKAAEQYRLAQGKPDTNASQVNFHLGMALARSGDKAGAEAAFAKVTGPLAPVAAYWRIYAKQGA